MKRLFFGGIHPKANKEMSTTVTALSTVTPRQVVIPMQQHIGAPCKPLVAVGDKVLVGQKVGDGEGLCVPVHASVSGTVIAVEPRPHTSGREVMAVVIENDFQDTACETRENNAPISEMSEDEIVNAIREAGIVGMGGASFPSSAKALSAMGKIDTLIANACECEPYITADDTLLRTDTEAVLEGLDILKHVLKTERVVLAIEDNKQQAIATIKGQLASHPGIELKVLPTMYPQGSEKQLIQAVTGREVAPGQLPASALCAVFNVATCAAVRNAVRMGKPLTQRIVTISGAGIKKPQNFVVRIGTAFADVIEAAGGLSEGIDKVISGGPMMGFAQADLSVPVLKATNSVLCLLKEKNMVSENPVCLRCGKCVGVCPMKLQPLYMYRYVLAGDVKQLEKFNNMDCIECGCCSFTCPAKLPLVETFRKGKQMLREAKK